MAWATFLAVFLLVGVGGMVRATGAGLGCPDWPKCWGWWLPPSGPGEIESFTDGAGKKFFKDKQGSVHPISEFDSKKMWIEYLNRMIGVVIGLMITVTFMLSIRLRKKDVFLFGCSLSALALVMIQGWLGAVVVQSGLQPGIITLHMLLAMLLLCLLLWIARRANSANPLEKEDQPHSKIGRILTGVVMLQVTIGTQVREGIDPFIKDSQGLSRETWLSQVGIADDLHRPVSWLVLILALLTWKSLRAGDSQLGRLALIAVGISLAQMTIGLILQNAGLPPIAQVFHLVGAAALVCISFCIGWPSRKIKISNA